MYSGTKCSPLITHLTYKNSVFAFKRKQKKKKTLNHILPYTVYYTFELLVIPKTHMLYFIGYIKYKKNNFTHKRFSSYVVTLEPNTQMKWNSIVVIVHVQMFALRLWSLLLQGKRHGCWPHLSPCSYYGTLQLWKVSWVHFAKRPSLP